ncbi:hypothetical protein EYC80_005687 [Monilinia laxa]|uniref:Uncharacterized protein n=1 Tax=Monilinia laxa TaxID=61186 RepID=A0A5N6KET6_MONLA|nr:hypothetical protein EYC80_005687 [Monilinia laxa]
MISTSANEDRATERKTWATLKYLWSSQGTCSHIGDDQSQNRGVSACIWILLAGWTLSQMSSKAKPLKNLITFGIGCIKNPAH